MCLIGKIKTLDELDSMLMNGLLKYFRTGSLILVPAASVIFDTIHFTLSIFLPVNSDPM